MAFPMVAVLERELVLYRRLWQASLLGSFLMPVLFLLSIGVGVGAYVGQVEGVSYLAWIVPGVLGSTAFQIAVGESTYPVLGDFKWVRAYHAMRATLVVPSDMVIGRQIYLMFRSLVAVTVFLVVAALFGGVHSWWAPLCLPVTALLSVAVSAPVTAFSASIENDSYFALLFRFFMIPATLFSGVFFPLDQVPVALRWLGYASPLWHAVELCRAATLGRPTPWPLAVHVAYLLVFAVGGVALAVWRFRVKLED